MTNGSYDTFLRLDDRLRFLAQIFYLNTLSINQKRKFRLTSKPIEPLIDSIIVALERAGCTVFDFEFNCGVDLTGNCLNCKTVGWYRE